MNFSKHNSARNYPSAEESPCGENKPVFYEPDDLKKARAKLMAHLSKHVPNEKFEVPVRMMVKWCFPVVGNHSNGEYKYTKPDLDNSNKLLQDCMTKLNFWKDDSYVVSLITESFGQMFQGFISKWRRLNELVQCIYRYSTMDGRF